MESKTVLVTGGAGFIGSALVRHLLAESDWRVVNVDCLTYAGNLESLGPAGRDQRHCFANVDICDSAAVRRLLEEYRPRGILHLAAESHVDRSIDGPSEFVRTNVMGTFALLQEALRYWRQIPVESRGSFRFLHVSTDEVFGSLGPEGSFSESTPYHPNSPYSATKAASDHLVRAWFHTYGLPTLVTNCSNNYGPCQFPEKLIPLVIQRALAGRPLPVYGTGANIRDWLFVDDHVRGILAAFDRGVPGETYCIGGGAERTNLQVVEAICGLLDELCPRSPGVYRDLVEFVPDRPGHDHRYAIDATKITRELAWSPQESFETGIRRTVTWYIENQEWCERVQSGAYRGERLGLGETR